MAVPPIISNSPLFKALKGNADNKIELQGSDITRTPSSDNVDISSRLQERVGDVQTLSAKEAAQTAENIANQLQGSDLALGLDPSFDK